MPRTPSRNPLTRRPARPLVTAVVALVFAGMAAATWITVQEFEAQRSVYSKILNQKLETTRDQFHLYLKPFGDHAGTLRRWHRAGLLELSDPVHTQALVAPLLDPDPQVAAVYLVPASGPAFRMVRRNGQWSAKQDATLAMELRQQSWYTAATALSDTAGLHWSDYLNLPGIGNPGLVSAHRNGDLVVGLGLLEKDLDSFTASAPITENGILIRTNTNGQVVWLTPLSGNRIKTTDAAFLLTSAQPEHAIIGTGMMEWGRRGRPMRTPFRFKLDRATWWCSFYKAATGTGPGQLGLMVPADELEKRFESASGKVTRLLFALVGLAMIAVVVVAFDYRNKWRRFARRKRPAPATEDGLARLVAEGESHRLEFKSTMRWNLHADKPGKEIELAWLKTAAAYLNTDGGFLVLGIADDGTVLGMEKDQFANEDKMLLHFDNLIKQHIGLEFAPYIKAEVRPLSERTVFLIGCDRCSEPVYLKTGDKEMFYVRMGPSTRELPASKVMDYLREREDG